MNIPKAIEYLKVEAASLHAQGFFLRENAVQLSIEALERVREYRPDMGGNDSEPLPGETQD